MKIFETIIVILIIGIAGAVMAFKVIKSGKGKGCGSCSCKSNKCQSKDDENKYTDHD